MVTLPDGADLTLGELQEMAAHQQQQIDSQQQLLVAKEQRLKYLKQQEFHHQQMSTDTDKLKALRDRVETQELKLRKLRAIQGQVDQQKVNSTGLSSELETIRSLFNEKEKELSLAVAKVDELTRQLEEIRKGRQQLGNNNASPAAIELEKLKKELLYRNKLNEQQSNRMIQQREILNNRKDEVTKMDKRISELQQRLQRKRLLNQQLANQINAATSAKQAQLRSANSNNKNRMNPLCGQNIAAIEPYSHKPVSDQDGTRDDLHTQLNCGNKIEDMHEFVPNKSDPKYQTLPYNTKFPVQKQKDEDQQENTENSCGVTRACTSESAATTNASNPTVPPPTSVSTNHIPNFSTSKPVVGTAQKVHQNGANIENVSAMPTAKLLAASQSISHLTPRPYSSSNLHNGNAVISAPNITSRIPLSKLNSSSMPTTSTTGVASNQTQVQSFSNTPTGDNSTNISGINSNISNQRTNSSQHCSIYQSKSTPVTLVRPHTLDNAPGGTLQQVQPEIAPKPSLPPKPTVPSKPMIPPRQIHSPSSGDKVDTSSESVDSALTILRGSDAGNEKNSPAKAGDFKLRLLYYTHYNRHVGKNVINSFAQRLGSAGLEDYMKNMNQIYKPDATKTESPAEQKSPNAEDNETKKLFPPELPIKPKPLTIKKSASAEQPKLKLNNNGSNPAGPTPAQTNVQVNRRIKMPPAFLFPESRTFDSNVNDLMNNGSDVGEEFSTKVVSPPNIVIECGDDASKSDDSDDDDEDLNGNHRNGVNVDQTSDEVSSPSCDNQNSNGGGSQNNTEKSSDDDDTSSPESNRRSSVVNRNKKGNLKTKTSSKNNLRVSFDPHALLLDASLEGELLLVKKTAKKVPNPSAPNDEGITALHNAICAGHFEVVKFLVEYGCDVNAQDSDGWTPLHCAASCNNLPMVKFLVENGACMFATTLSDHETAAEKCEEDEEGFDGCSEYLYSIQEKLGILNNGVVYAVYNFEAHNPDELSYNDGDQIIVLRKGDEYEREWWWSRINDREGYIPRNLLGLYPRRTANHE
ncbi:PPP1R13B (predicted) [Pycnogonum litorale]